MSRYFSSILASFLIVSQVFAGLPPTTLSGENASSKPTTFTLKAPKHQVTQVSGVESLIETGNSNELKNPGFEGGTTGWTASAGTFTATTTSTEIISGRKSGSWDSNGAGQTLTSDAITVPQGLKGGNAALGCRFMVPTGTATYTIGLWDGSVLSQAQTLSSNVVATVSSLNFIAPSSGTVAIRITSVAADEPELEIDDCYLGTAWGFNISSVSQATLFGSATYATTASCSWSTTSGSYADYAVDADCPTPSVTGNASAPATKIPGITFASLPPGHYMIVAASSGIYDNGSAADNVSFRLFDGTNQLGTSAATAGTNAQPVNEVTGFRTVTSAESNVTIRLQGNSSGGSTNRVDVTAAPLQIFVYRFPTAAETLVHTQNGDYGWTQYTPTFTGFGTVVTHNCYHRRESEDLLLQCRFTAGTTTATEAQVSLPGTLVSSSSYATLEIAGSGASGTTTGNVPLVLIEPSVSRVTFGRTGVASLSKQNGSNIWAAGEAVSFFARVRIQGWTVNNNAPVLVGSVTSSSAGAERMERLSATCSTSASAITSQSGSWVSSISNGASSSQCTINIVAGSFGSAPACSCTINGNVARSCGFTSVTTTSAVVTIRDNNSGAYPATEGVNILCMGPR